MIDTIIALAALHEINNVSARLEPTALQKQLAEQVHTLRQQVPAGSPTYHRLNDLGTRLSTGVRVHNDELARMRQELSAIAERMARQSGIEQYVDLLRTRAKDGSTARELGEIAVALDRDVLSLDGLSAINVQLVGLAAQLGVPTELTSSRETKGAQVTGGVKPWAVGLRSGGDAGLIKKGELQVLRGGESIASLDLGDVPAAAYAAHLESLSAEQIEKLLAPLINVAGDVDRLPVSAEEKAAHERLIKAARESGFEKLIGGTQIGTVLEILLRIATPIGATDFFAHGFNAAGAFETMNSMVSMVSPAILGLLSVSDLLDAIRITRMKDAELSDKVLAWVQTALTVGSVANPWLLLGAVGVRAYRHSFGASESSMRLAEVTKDIEAMQERIRVAKDAVAKDLTSQMTAKISEPS